MNTLLLSINWNPNPELFNLFGLSIRYYGLLWAVGIFLAYVIVHYQYRDKKIDEKKFDPLFFYCFFGILIGARLGHCLFYEPDYFLAHPLEMILPICYCSIQKCQWKIWHIRQNGMSPVRHFCWKMSVMRGADVMM